MTEESEDFEASASTANQPTSQLLTVSPKDLYFAPPYSKDVSTTITLSNPTNEPVTFKIKTTAPKRYIVRPPLGVCPPNQTMEIAVSLAYHKDPPAQLDKGDKFQVQAFVLKSPPDSAAATQDLLKEIWKGKPAVTKTKIAAHFSAPPESASASNATNAAAGTVPSAAVTAAPVPTGAIVNATPTEPAVSAPAVVAAEPVAAITAQSYPPKSRANEPASSGAATAASAALTSQAQRTAPFDGLVDPVSTAPPASQNVILPLVIVFLLGLLLGFFGGMYVSRA